MAETHPQLIQQYSSLVLNGRGEAYTVQSWAKKIPEGNWEGWLEYHPLNAETPVRRTPALISRPGRRELTQWAARLGEDYLEAAFDRAK